MSGTPADSKFDARRTLPRAQRLAGPAYAVMLVLALLLCSLGVFGGFSGAGLFG